MGTTWVEVVTDHLIIQGFIFLDFVFQKCGSDRVTIEAFSDIADALQNGNIKLKHAEDIVKVPFADIPKV